jgi:hypothetical protein
MVPNENGSKRSISTSKSSNSIQSSSSNSKPSLPERFTRIQLCRISLDQLRFFRDRLAQKVEAANAELLCLLEERDGLSMQRDALAVEVQDLRDLAERRQRTEQKMETSSAAEMEQKRPTMNGGREGREEVTADIQ